MPRPRKEKPLIEVFEEIPDEELKKTKEFQEGMAILKLICRKTLTEVERYGQWRYHDLLDRGIRCKMISEIADTGRGVRITIELIPEEQNVIEVLKKRTVKNILRRLRKMENKMERRYKYGF